MHWVVALGLGQAHPAVSDAVRSAGTAIWESQIMDNEELASQWMPLTQSVPFHPAEHSQLPLAIPGFLQTPLSWHPSSVVQLVGGTSGAGGWGVGSGDFL